MEARKQCFGCRGKPGGGSEPEDRAACAACASGQREAASACEVQSVPPHAGFGGGKFCFASQPLGATEDVVCALVLRQDGPTSDLQRAHCVLHVSFMANNFKTHS